MKKAKKLLWDVKIDKFLMIWEYGYYYIGFILVNSSFHTFESKVSIERLPPGYLANPQSSFGYATNSRENFVS